MSGLPQRIEFELRKLFDNIDHVKFLAISESDLNTVTLEVGREETVAGDENEESGTFITVMFVHDHQLVYKHSH